MSDNNQHTVCIIGGGMSGLFTGALLARNGYKVTVLEKNAIIGGGLQSFRRGDAIFNTGLQVFCGYDNRFTLTHLLDYVGIERNKLHVFPLDNQSQEIVWINDSKCFYLPKGRIKYEAYLVSQFPEEANGIHNLLDSVYEIGNTFDYFYMRRIQRHPEIIQYAQITAEQLIRHYIKDETLIKLLGYVGPHLGYNLSKIPATDLGMILTLYIEGSYRFVDGNIQLANALALQIQTSGGTVISNSEVKKIDSSDKSVRSVSTIDNSLYEADAFVWAASPKILYTIGGDNLLRSSTCYRIQEYSNNSSNYSVYITLKRDSFPFINSWVFLPLFDISNELPLYMTLLTPPTSLQKKYAKTLEICIPTHFSYFKVWENTTMLNRTPDYIKIKKEFGEKIIKYIAHFYPEIENSVENIEVATPLTIRDYYGNPQGATYGQQGLFLPIKTRMDNLFLSGQAVQYQGLFGVMATAINTCETILGRSIIEEIAKA